ncbi:MAG: type II secretion system secretin GspD [Dokdonella sp.]|nr:type II secretion system secretin GspD [Dokdonella sp.]MCW5566608.1 type II secretion system secretin GspD [Dokdonella sp.]
MECAVSFRLPYFAWVAAITLLAGCATRPVQSPAHLAGEPLTADNFAAKTAPRPPVDPSALGGIDVSGRDESALQAPKPEIEVGTGKFIDEAAARKPLPDAAGDGQVDFNFENNPIQAVVKAILGDLLQQNYTIAPNVGGNVSFSTSKPIRADQAMGVLEMLLSWTGNTLVYKDGRYIVLQIKDALPGYLTPRMTPPNLAKGYEVRVFPLRYVSPSEMAKLLKPYAKPEAVVNADTARSMIVMAGTSAELQNYAQTIDMFDVDWMKGMSIGVFTLQRTEVATLLPELEKVFGATGESPLAGMFRFLPIERSNAIIAMTPQPEYLRQAEDWLRRLDRAGDESMTQLFVYDVKNIKSVDLADYLNQIFLGSSSGGGSRRTGTSGSVAPGLTPVTVGGGMGRSSSRQSGRRGATSAPANATAAAASGAAAGAAATPVVGGGNQDSALRITAVEESNQLLVMATPIEWDAMQAAIRKLDIAPLQVHIETKILEVTLSGELKYGVQWWFAGMRGQAPYTGVDYDVLNRTDRQRSGMGAAGPGESGNIFWSYLNSKFQVALSALEANGQAKVLSAPSLVVINNQEAQINVGTQIPIQQTYLTNYGINTGTNNTGIASSGYGTVQYLDTGVMLSVKPRVNPGGLVYLEVSQDVSSPGTPAEGNSNPPINQRTIDTQIAVQSGETVLLGGLISEDDGEAKSGVPGLHRVPVLGKLFGSTSARKNRTELIVLITPQVMSNSEEAREITESYRRQFQALEPLRARMKGSYERPSPREEPPPAAEEPPPAETTPLE